MPRPTIAAITLLWKFGANPVLSFWLAYILTRPLGANIGDWLASPKAAQNPGDPTGLDLGTFTTSLVFLGLILATVIYLTVTRSDVTETHEATHPAQAGGDPRKERVALAGFGLLAVATAGLLVWAHGQPHVGPAPEEDNTSAVHMAPGEAVKKFPPAKVAVLKTLASTSLEDARSGNATGAHAAAQGRVTCGTPTRRRCSRWTRPAGPPSTPGWTRCSRPSASITRTRRCRLRNRRRN
ncbi:hypothetical protein [Streptomyces sp. WELS2]|uniref:hypothetical protein n=1 Tax=Streptomyces sp. WELS2 TaxID=2749435 RepID=UPI00215DBD4D|nr:hypothetical protein [Streptomyces sp. WELS2]